MSLRNSIRADKEIKEIDTVSSIVRYKRTWKVLIMDGLLRKEDSGFYTKNVPESSNTYVDVSKRIVVAASENPWSHRTAIYLNEEYFSEQVDMYEVLNVEGMANFPDSMLLCRQKSDGNRLWTKETTGKYHMNADYFPDEKSRQARIIEIMADLESPIVSVPATDPNDMKGTLVSLMETVEFKKQIDEALQKNH